MNPQQKKLIVDLLIENSFYLLLSLIALITLFFISAARVAKIMNNYSNIALLTQEEEALNRRRQILSEAKETDVVAFHQTLSRLIPTEENVISVYQAVERFSKNTDLTITKMNTPALNQKSETSKVSFSIKEPLDDFLRKIENYLIASNRLMTINSIRYDAISSTFDIEATYYWKSKLNIKSTPLKPTDWGVIRNIHEQYQRNFVKISK